MIRIATWNCCRGKPEVKLPRLFDKSPDVVAVQECARPFNWHGGTRAWYGSNPNQGLLALAVNGFQVKPVSRKRTTAKFFFPVRVTGAVAFNMLVIWAKPSKQRPSYVSTLCRGIRAYRDFIKSHPTIILGDLNSAACFGEAHGELVDMLRDEFGLVSAYHEYFGVDHGRETHYTYFDRTKKGKPFHIDYCFIPKSWIPKLKSVTVGKHRAWSDLSDHVPLIIELNK